MEEGAGERIRTDDVRPKICVQQVQTDHLTTQIGAGKRVNNNRSNDGNAACDDSDETSAIVPFRSDERENE
tara:strand:- start:614 stop:826 length:213 start_codon:yes stop_codon:yes gene_type:complete